MAWEKMPVGWGSFLKKQSLASIVWLEVLVSFRPIVWSADIHERVNHAGYTNVEFFMLINLTLVRTEGELSICLQCFPAAKLLLQCLSFHRTNLAHPKVTATFLVLGSQGQTELPGCWSCLLSTLWEDICIWKNLS